MHAESIGWLRPALGALLLAVGLVLRFGRFREGRGPLLGLPWADRDPDILRRTRHRTGEMLATWAAWLGVEMAAGMPESWAASVVAPLVIVSAVTLSYPARLYARRHLPRLAGRGAPGADRALPARGGWAVVILRETVPFAAILGPILIVRRIHGDLPERIPVAWALHNGPYVWMQRTEALELLRHQTMLVYLLLAGLEGVYLVATWAGGNRRDIARRMLTPRHWLYFLFKTGWVALFAGLNLGFVRHARSGSPPYPYLLPGIAALVVLGILAALETRRSRADPAPPGP